MDLNLIKKCINSIGTPQIFGVDVNTNEIKMFQIENSRKSHRIVGWSRRNLPEKMFDDLILTDPGRFGEILKDGLSSAKGKKIKGDAVFLSIPENKIFLRLINMPLMADEEVKESIHFEVESNIPISISDVYYDWQTVARGKKEMKVLVVACARAVIDNLLKAFEMAGLHVLAIEADSIAMGRSVFPTNYKEPVLVIDVGIESSSYFIYQEGYPVFSSSSSVSGKIFTNLVAKQFNLPWDKAEQYKVKNGLGSSNKEREELIKLYNPILSSLVSEIEKTIAFFDEKLAIDGKKINQIVVCGGGSNLKGLIPYLSINLKKKIAQANPWQRMQIGKEIPPISIEEAQSYITAIGLALRENNGN